MNQVHFTIAILTYNGANYLPKILERLQAQVNSDSLFWESAQIR